MIVRESFKLSPANIYLPSGRCIKDDFPKDGAFSGDAPDTLLVKVAGTHGGFVNHNGFFYKQSGMEIGYLTWTQPYQKAVLENHDEHGTPLGRVIDSRFTIDQPDFYRANFGATKNIPSCHIDLILSITSADAIGKIGRGEFLTVSQSSLCREITCSACGADILSDERCDHMRNSKVDDNRVYWIFGPLTYKELSFVNIPSDEYAIIEEVGLEKEEVEDTWPSDSRENFGALVIMDTIKEPSMAQKKPEKSDPESNNEEFSPEDEEMIEQLEKEVELFFDTLSELLPDDIADKTLSAKERKALPASAFCGPKRSFPVNDCGHVQAALARIKGYKGPGSKTKIRACVDAAAKRLKCFKEEDQITLEGFLASMGLDDAVIPKSDHEDAVTKIRGELEDKIKALEGEKTEAEEKVTTLESQEKDNLAAHIADLKKAMGNIQDAEKYTAMVDEMKGRTLDSLKDTIKDLRDEIGTKELIPVTDPAAGKTKDNIPEGETKALEFTDRTAATRHLVYGPTKQEK